MNWDSIASPASICQRQQAPKNAPHRSAFFSFRVLHRAQHAGQKIPNHIHTRKRLDSDRKLGDFLAWQFTANMHWAHIAVAANIC